MVKLEEVLATHEEICNKARSVIKTKGQDYNRGQQEKDTLFNMSVAPLLGITDTVTQGILVRLSDKFMRLISLTKDPKENPAVTNESVRDTIEDTINYLVYLYIKYEEERKKVTNCATGSTERYLKALKENTCGCACGCNNKTDNDHCDSCKRNLFH